MMQKGGWYREGDNWKGDWEEVAFMIDDPGRRTAFQEYYVTNYEDRIGRFTARVLFYDRNMHYINLYNDDGSVRYLDYNQVTVGPRETEYKRIYFSDLTKIKPKGAESFNLVLIEPEIEECQQITKYQPVSRSRSITKYDPLFAIIFGKSI